MLDGLHKMVGKDLIDSAERLAEQEVSVKRKGVYYQTHKREIGVVADALRKIEVTRAEADVNCIDLHVAGDKHVLQALFGAFRKLGYEPDSRPGNEPETTFSCYWNHPDHNCKFWVYFSSTVCKRIKVGTETIERDIYETVCE